jgi:broad specificity phosphatase PhoE
LKLIFVRHGESIANVQRRFSGSAFKDPLTDKGVEQAHATARNLSGLVIERIYSSPILRAQQTAQILAESLHAPLEIAEALREYSVGIYEGKADPAGWEALHRVEDDWFVRHKLDSKMPGGESAYDVQRRFVPFVERLLRDGSDKDRTLLLVGHYDLYVTMLPAILTNVTLSFAREHGFPYANYVVAETRPEGLCCISWCGVAVGG